MLRRLEPRGAAPLHPARGWPSLGEATESAAEQLKWTRSGAFSASTFGQPASIRGISTLLRSGLLATSSSTTGARRIEPLGWFRAELPRVIFWPHRASASRTESVHSPRARAGIYPRTVFLRAQAFDYEHVLWHTRRLCPRGTDAAANQSGSTLAVAVEAKQGSASAAPFAPPTRLAGCVACFPP